MCGAPLIHVHTAQEDKNNGEGEGTDRSRLLLIVKYLPKYYFIEIVICALNWET